VAVPGRPEGVRTLAVAQQVQAEVDAAAGFPGQQHLDLQPPLAWLHVLLPGQRVGDDGFHPDLRKDR
jgi:hypothetical protein